MPLSISSNAIVEKNKMNSDGAWILLLEVIYPGEDPVRACSNNEVVTWNGESWPAYPFKLGDIEESKDGDQPSLSLEVNDLARIMIPEIEARGGGVGAEAWIRIVHSKHLSNTTPEFEEMFEIVSVSIDSGYMIKFQLGIENLMTYRVPQNRYLKNHCRYKEFKGALCGYTGSESNCNRTFARCKELGNQTRFGGQPGVGNLGIQV